MDVVGTEGSLAFVCTVKMLLPAPRALCHRLPWATELELIELAGVLVVYLVMKTYLYEVQQEVRLRAGNWDFLVSLISILGKP